MHIYIDADGCPVVREVVSLCRQHSLDCTIICDTAHIFNIDGAEIITVDKGADSVDLKLANIISKGDIAVTQDYGLAALCLAKQARAINQNGLVYTDANISMLLDSRYVSKKIRNSGGRLKGPKKRTSDDDKAFISAFTQLLTEETDDE